MMNFLRKHQRLLFIIISVMTIASFSFFGTFSSFATAEKVADKEIAKAIDGSPIMERDVQGMVRFFSFGNSDVMQRDLFSTGMASILVEKYFDSIKKEFQARLEKVKRYRPYAHPQLSFLNAEEVWKQFIPQLNLHLAELKKSDASPETFALYCRLYLDQAAFPPDILKRVLAYQQQQYGWMEPDPLMTEERLALLGFRSLEEWFGEEFMKRACCFLINAALMAEKRGYEISTEEARANLLQNALHTLQSQVQKQTVSYQDAHDFLREKLRFSGVEETTAIKIWKRVMLFRRLFEDVSQAVFLDRLTYEQFASYAGENASVELYKLPDELHLENFRAFLKLRFYLDAVAPKSHPFCPLPTHFSSPEEVEKKFPELVQNHFHLEVAKVTKEEIAQKITLRETWDFEVSDGGWECLKKEFPLLNKVGEHDRESRFQILERVERDIRLKIDRFARDQIVKAHPEWIEEALRKKPFEKVEAKIRSRGATYPFLDIEDPSHLLSHLHGGSIGEQLPVFSSKEESFYRITVLEKPKKKELMTYKEALQNDLLGELLDNQLEGAYSSIRKKDPKLFQLEDGSWKPFEKVKNEIGAKVFSDSFKEVEAASANPADYSAKYLLAYMEGAKKNIREKGEESPFLKPAENRLCDQWLLSKKRVTIKRSDATFLPKEELFTVAEGSWSSVCTPVNGDISFFKLLSRKANEDRFNQQIDQGQQILGMDAKRFFMHQILESMSP